jgi:predicted Na+-dependent transporter
VTLQLRRWGQAYWELLVVMVGAVVGLTVQSPLIHVVRHQGIDILLVILVFSTAIGIESQSLRGLPAAWRRLALALVVGATVLPALSWLLSDVVAAGALRHGVSTIGLAPCEIASVATTAMASGDVALAGGLLIGSTFICVGVAGPILALETSGSSIHPGHIIINLLVVVVLPLIAGVSLRAFVRLPSRAEVVASTTSTLSVAALVALVAAEVHFSRDYLPVLLATVLFVAATAVVGRLIGHGAGRPILTALLLTTSMRDFAIAAALATAAFGPAAAAPLGVYGVVVIVWGTGTAGYLRSRSS